MPNILIVKINASSNTETFIEGHIKHIEGVCNVVYGRSELLYDNETNKLLTNEENSWKKIALKIQRMLTGASYQEQLIRAQSKYIKKNRIDLIIAEYGLSGCHILEGARRAKVPMIVFFHGYDANNRDTVKKYKSRYQKLFEYADFIIGVSKSMCERLKSYGAPQRKVVHLPYGVKLNGKSAEGKLTSYPSFIHVGRLDNMKAPYLTIMAFAKVRKEIPEAKLFIVGNTGLGEDYNAIAECCLNLVKALNIKDNVEFFGNVDHGRVFELLKMSWVFVLHSMMDSVGNAEGTPNAVLEAMSVGLPVVSTKHEGIMDVVHEGKSGYLVEEGDIDQMSRRMLDLAADKSLVSKMGTFGRQLVQEHLTYAKYLKRIESLIEKTISE